MLSSLAPAAPVCGAATSSRVTRRPPASLAVLRPAVVSRAARTLARAIKADDSVGADAGVLGLIADITAEADARHADVLASNATSADDIADLSEGNVLKAKVAKSLDKLQKGLLERETEVRLLLLAALCGEHLLLLGPPGTAKSELSRRLSALCGGAYFERLLTRFSVPEELFGPLSMKGLENDEYVRQIEGWLPTSEVAFIDEIFKANSAILNALLTLLNERLFDNGSNRLHAPLLTCVGASNELPESEELDALYDRFLLRRQVAQVSAPALGNLARLASGHSQIAALHSSTDSDSDVVGAGSPIEDVAELSMDEFRACATDAVAGVELPESVIDMLIELRTYLQDKAEPPVYVSDRRFMKSVNLLQVAAHSDGRTLVNEYDCLLLEHVFGNRPDDSHKVREFLLETIASDPGLQQAELVFLGLFGRAMRVLEGGGFELLELRTEVTSLVELLESRHKELCTTLDGAFPELRHTVWQSEGTVQQAVQALTPQMTENRSKTEVLLREALLLSGVLAQEGADATVLQKMLPRRFKQYERGISSKS